MKFKVYKDLKDVGGSIAIREDGRVTVMGGDTPEVWAAASVFTWVSPGLWEKDMGDFLFNGEY